MLKEDTNKDLVSSLARDFNRAAMQEIQDHSTTVARMLKQQATFYSDLGEHSESEELRRIAGIFKNLGHEISEVLKLQDMHYPKPSEAYQKMKAARFI